VSDGTYLGAGPCSKSGERIESILSLSPVADAEEDEDVEDEDVEEDELDELDDVDDVDDFCALFVLVTASGIAPDDEVGATTG